MRNYIAVALFFNLVSVLCAYEGSLSFEQAQGLNSTTTKEEVSNNQWLSLSFGDNRPSMSRNWGYRYAFDLNFFLQTSDYAFSIPEFYREHKKGRHSFAVGRKNVDWFKFGDSFWMMDHINGNRGLTLLDTQQEGIIGLHYTYKRGSLNLSFLGSFLHVPSLNPTLKIKDGEVSSPVAWVKKPPLITDYNGVKTPLYYQDPIFSYSDIVFNETLGFKLAYKWKNGNFSGFGIYKPENNLRMNAEAVYNQESLGGERIEVTPFPTVNHHMVYGLGIEHQAGDLDLGVGLKSVDPNADVRAKLLGSEVNLKSERKNFISDNFKIEPTYQREDYLQAKMLYNQNDYSLHAYYVKLLSESNKGDDFGSAGTKWQEALGGALNLNFSDNFHFDFSWRYDLQMEDSLIKGEMGYRFIKDRYLRLGVELLESKSENSYWSGFRTNDVIYSRFSFLF